MFLHIFIMDVSIVEVSESVVDYFWFLIYVVIGESLEGWGSIHEAECHYVELVWSTVGVERCEPFVT